ncbi:AraC family transcriptional regulator, partial [Bacillus albus]
MKLDVNELAEYLANNPFRVEGVYRYAKNPGVPC